MAEVVLFCPCPCPCPGWVWALLHGYCSMRRLQAVAMGGAAGVCGVFVCKRRARSLRWAVAGSWPPGAPWGRRGYMFFHISSRLPCISSPRPPHRHPPHLSGRNPQPVCCVCCAATAVLCSYRRARACLARETPKKHKKGRMRG